MSRTRAKRYLGMTVPQLGVLAVLGLCICSVLVGGYGWLNSMVAAAYVVPESNFTPVPSVTPLPSETPLPTPSQTPITYESLIPAGWKQFKSDAAPGMEIWFPPSYETLTENLMQQYNMHYIPYSDSQNQQGLKSILNLIDLTPSPYSLFTTFGMSTQPLPAADLDKAIDQEFADLMLRASLIERGKFEIGNYPARKVVFDITRNGVNAGMVAYLIQENVTAWYLGFTTPYNELYTRMPDFDRIAQTFRIVTP